ncbi:WD40 repeat-containing protein [Streptomyces violaceusniger Tu 4113]|uniref:WD40 repeat-containing protein n=2 Tax=Streptomyces violaceusniger TaxID=68280 RepID=G2PGJ4_STRV4|nr:WD40 repeat-containing protein [Streptomyces violaceusniger Tu 4113]
MAVAGMDEREPSPEDGRGAASSTGRTGPDGTTEANADAEELSQLRAERDHLLAERERLRHELNGPPSHPPRIPPEPPPHFPATPDAPLQEADAPPPSRRRLLVGAGAAVVMAAVAVPTAIALLDDDTDDAKDTARAKPGTHTSGDPSPTPARTPPPVAIPADPGLRPLATLKGHRGDIGTLRFSPDGKTLASSEAHDGVLRLWDVATRKQRAKALLSSLVVFKGVAFSPDGRTVATGHESRAQFWDATTLRPRGKEIAKHEDPFLSFETIAFSPDGTIFATSGFIDQEIRFYDAATHRQKATPLESKGADKLVFSPDGKTLAGVDESGMDGVRLWDVATRTQRPKPPNDFFGGSNHMAFSPDSTTLAVAGSSNDVRFFDPLTGKERGGPLDSHVGSVTGLAYATDGKSVLTADYSGLHVWDAATRKRRATISVPGATSIAQLAFSPDGRTLATLGFQDKTIHLWRLE